MPPERLCLGGDSSFYTFFTKAGLLNGSQCTFMLMPRNAGCTPALNLGGANAPDLSMAADTQVAGEGYLIEGMSGNRNLNV